ncbi:TetR/AcrR family transcriptional regulator [Catellatospora sichuanensis]|uniref:TetR/AcrR family transcriptional regulator n=1 Tax=Catellatospora sichuanensis TaxID=1969805 RepID=UPI00118295C8|nr:TetR-like C-terminal domain-containing protein [Catellatospora sichuanensis]
MPRAGLSTQAVVQAAVEVIDDDGVAALTLAAVAARCGVAAPSLYKHVSSLAELKTLLGVRVLNELADRFAAAAMGRSGADAITALMHAYRAYVMAHPARYAAMPVDPLHHPDLAAAGIRQLEVIQAALRPWQLDPADQIHTIRKLRVVAHGFASLESAGGFGLPEDLDETYRQLIATFLDSLPAHP